MEDLTKEQLEIFQELFDILDNEGDKSITYRELGIVLRAMGGKPSETDVQSMINESDLDGNGSLEFTEFTRMLLRKLADTNHQGDLREAFKIYDKDNNGFISTAELRTLYTSIGFKLSDDDFEEMIREADTDLDGVLTYDEFVEMMTSKG